MGFKQIADLCYITYAYMLHARSLSFVQVFATPWTIAQQAPLSTGLSRQEYWNGLPFPSPWDLSNPGIEFKSAVLVGEFFTTEPTGKLLYHLVIY